MNNDDHGFVDDPRNGQSGESQEVEKGIATQDGQGDISSNGGHIADERSGGKKGEAGEIVAALQKIGVSSSWSGLLPRPEDFAKYDKEVQDKMIAWNDRTIFGQTDQQDKLVDAEIKQGYLSQTFTFIINASIVVGVLIAFAITENPNVFWAFTLPGASVIGNVAITIRGKAEDKERDDDA